MAFKYLLLACSPSFALSEYALLNLILPGEDLGNSNDPHLSAYGSRRAEYLGRCAASGLPTMAFPLGPPQRLLASSGLSLRPEETLSPLSKHLHVPVKNTVPLTDVQGFVDYLQNTSRREETLLAAWDHNLIPSLVKAIDPRQLAPEHFSVTCAKTGSADHHCHDVMWQLVLTREDSNALWHVSAFSKMHMGFDGIENGTCSSALAVYSDPVNWQKLELAVVPTDGIRSMSFFGSHSGSELLLGVPLLVQFLVLLVQVRLCRVSRASSKPENHLEQSLLSEFKSDEAEAAAPSGQCLKVAGAAFAILLALVLAWLMYANTSLATCLALISFLRAFCAGGVAGALTTTIIYPIQRVKQLLQTQDKIPDIASGKVPPYAGIADCFRRVYKEEGLLAFWRGNLANILRYFPVAAFSFAFLGSIQDSFPKYDPNTQFLQLLLVNVLAGGIAGACSLTIVYPLDYANTRLASDIGKAKSSSLPLSSKEEAAAEQEFSGICDCLHKTIRSKGLLSLYTGYTASVVGIIVYRAPYFGLFDTLNALNPYQDASAVQNLTDYLLGILVSFLVAQVTSAVASFLSYPFDTVRRRLQMEANRSAAERQYKNALHCACEIARLEGVHGFYKGFLANLILGAGGSIMLIVFQQIDGSSDK